MRRTVDQRKAAVKQVGLTLLGPRDEVSMSSAKFLRMEDTGNNSRSGIGLKSKESWGGLLLAASLNGVKGNRTDFS